MIGPPATPTRSLVGQQRFQPGPFLVGQIVSMRAHGGSTASGLKIRGTRSDMEAVLSRGQGEAVSMAVAVDTASVAGCALVVASVSVSTRCQSDMRGLVTAGRTVRLVSGSAV